MLTLKKNKSNNEVIRFSINSDNDIKLIKKSKN